MKKKLFPICAVVLASSMLFSSCIGSFGLSNKVLSWNQQISNKFVNELVFIGFWILPVYEISMLADVIVINSVEFWSGSNPIVAGQKVVNGEDGRYLVEWNKDGYTITNESTQSVVELNFNEDERTWSVATPEGDIPFLTFVDDTHVKVPAGNGEYQIVEFSQAGVMAYQEYASKANLAMK